MKDPNDGLNITETVRAVLCEIDPAGSPQISRFKNTEDGSFYNVWRIDYPSQSFVMKQAKGREAEIYHRFSSCDQLPNLYNTVCWGGNDYLLMEYIPGKDLTFCDRDSLIKTLDALIAMQKAYWMSDDTVNTFAGALENRRIRRDYLLDPLLEAVYDRYLQRFETMPRTLCHDDLLPFNVIVSGDRAVFVDWEVGGILPYLTSFARLIAHCEEDEAAFFYMNDEDKTFAIFYYFDHFVKKMGIDYSTYRRDLYLFLFYEFCEWVYVGNKYSVTDTERFRKYRRLAGNATEKIMNNA